MIFYMNPLLGFRLIQATISLIFFEKIKVKKFKCRLLQFLFGALRVKGSKLATAIIPLLSSNMVNRCTFR